MFRSGLERGHNEAIPAVIKTPDYWGKQNLAHHLILSHVNASLTCRDRAKRKKTLCAPREPQKVLVVELLCSTRCTGCPYEEHRVVGHIGPFKAGNLLPF